MKSNPPQNPQQCNRNNSKVVNPILIKQEKFLKREEDDNTSKPISTLKRIKWKIRSKKNAENGWRRKLGSWMWRLETKKWMQCKVFIKIIIISIESFESNRKIQSTLTISSFPVVFCSTYYCYTPVVLTTSCCSSSSCSRSCLCIYQSIYFHPLLFRSENNTKEKIILLKVTIHCSELCNLQLH